MFKVILSAALSQFELAMLHQTRQLNVSSRIVQIALRDKGIPPEGGMDNFPGRIFLWDGGYLSRSYFDHLNLFQR